MSPNLHRNRLREKKKSEPVGSDFCGGDEGDRTPYLLNAIQALSQVSYTPTGLPSRDCFAIIANPAGNVNPLFRENLKDFFAAYSALSLKALNAL